MNSTTVGTEIWNISDNLNFDTQKRYQATMSDEEEILSPYEGENGNPFQHSCLENSMGTGGWWTIVLRVTKSQT